MRSFSLSALDRAMILNPSPAEMRMAIQFGDVKVQWLGHDGFLVTGAGKHVYLDPYQINPRDKPPADYLLITHSHYDHLSVPDIEPLVTTNTTVICPPDCASKLQKFRMGKLHVLEAGGVYSDGIIEVKGVPAYNPTKPFHPRENGWLGYLVTLDKVTIYHSGDTDLIPEMKKIKCNVALLPVSGTYVMTAEEAAEAANLIEADVSIPMHWGAIIGVQTDADEFKKRVKGKVVILEREA